MLSKRQLRKQRLHTANAMLAVLQSELAFEQIYIEVSDDGRHWRFKYGHKHLADFWPASSKGLVAGSTESVSCVSVVHAKRLAIGAKRQLFVAIAQALKQVI